MAAGFIATDNVTIVKDIELFLQLQINFLTFLKSSLFFSRMERLIQSPWHVFVCLSTCGQKYQKYPTGGFFCS